MVAHILRLLSIALLTFVLTSPAAGGQRCLQCHQAHFAERGDCTACHRGNPAADRKNIAHANLVSGRYAGFTMGETDPVRRGKRLIEQYACRRCHVVAGRGNRLAASLDLAAARKAPPELAKALLQPAAAMPDFRLNEAGETAIINALQSAALTQRPQNSIQPQIVHFSTSTVASQDLFSRKCGSCHRILCQRSGALGQGDIGPNLSGLLSTCYPQSFRAGLPWTEARLASWLQNPRIIRPGALMLPVDLSSAELAELVSIMLDYGGETVSIVPASIGYRLPDLSIKR